MDDVRCGLWPSVLESFQRKHTARQIILMLSVSEETIVFRNMQETELCRDGANRWLHVERATLKVKLEELLLVNIWKDKISQTALEVHI